MKGADEDEDEDEDAPQWDEKGSDAENDSLDEISQLDEFAKFYSQRFRTKMISAASSSSTGAIPSASVQLQQAASHRQREVVSLEDFDGDDETPPSLPIRHVSDRNLTCKYFNTGSCEFGDCCRFLHVPECVGEVDACPSSSARHGAAKRLRPSDPPNGTVVEIVPVEPAPLRIAAAPVTAASARLASTASFSLTASPKQVPTKRPYILDASSSLFAGAFT